MVNRRESHFYEICGAEMTGYLDYLVTATYNFYYSN